jgi:hypothetical protein
MTKFGKILTGLIVLVFVVLVVYLLQRKVPIVVAPEVPEENQNQNTILGNKDDLITFSILPNTSVKGVVSYRGTIKGAYFFEGNILINVLDANKKVLKASNAIAKTDWMTAGPVDFEGNIDFGGLPAGAAYLEIHNDNASGLPENDKSILIPIVIEKAAEASNTGVVLPAQALAFLKSFVKENEYADIKECKKDGKLLFATYPNTGLADAPTTFYDEKGKELEVCGGFRREPDPATSLCKTTLPSCVAVYYKSFNHELSADIDTYNLN